MTDQEKVCSLMIYEMSLKEGLAYNEKQDIVEGLEDHGLAGKTQTVANSALVSMICGIASSWKQPIYVTILLEMALNYIVSHV